MKLIIRITDKSGRRIERHTLGKKPLTIGRAWDNDIILQDQFVDADHLSVSLLSAGDNAGRLELHDWATTNGTMVDNRSIVGEDNRYRSGEKIKIGDTTLEILDASVAVEKTAVRSFWFFMHQRFHSLPSLFWLTLVALVVGICDQQLLTAEPTKLSNALLTMSLTLLFLLVWSLLFGFISKLIRGESNIRTHWALACVGLVVINVLAWLLLVIRFNMQAVDLTQALTALVMGCVSVVLLYALLTYATHLSARYKILCSTLVVIGVVASFYSDMLLKEPHQRWTAQGPTEAGNLPPVFMLRDASDIDQYMQDTSYLFTEFDRLADE